VQSGLRLRRAKPAVSAMDVSAAAGVDASRALRPAKRLAELQAEAQAETEAQQAACPPGQQLLTQMGVQYCGRPGPARPEDCPTGYEPVGVTGACAPREGL
jgi:hypothetical protein